jgi:membrane associated rhomboid family serine protease
MANAAHTIREELTGIGVFIGAIWGVFALSFIVPSVDHYGIVPRTVGGLVGIVAAPFLHANLGHIVSNTVPLFILLVLLAGSKAQSWTIVVEIVLLGGFLLWLFGRSADHIGASGLIFGLIAFLLVSGFLEKRAIPLIVSLAVGILYGWTLLWGVIPRLGSSISWDGHLWSAVAGGIVAYALTKEEKQLSQSQEDVSLIKESAEGEHEQ